MTVTLTATPPLPWGYICPEGGFRPLPKGPMLAAGMGPPPFTVTLPIGEVRHIIEQPIELRLGLR